MALSYYFTFNAPATKSAPELEKFLKIVEKEARCLGFNPTLVLNAPFDTDERRAFARRLTTGERIESEKLKGVVLVRKEQVFSHDPVHGDCRLIPVQGVILAVTDEMKQEIVFGFLRYPKTLKDANGKKDFGHQRWRRLAVCGFRGQPRPPIQGHCQNVCRSGLLEGIARRIPDEIIEWLR